MAATSCRLSMGEKHAPGQALWLHDMATGRAYVAPDRVGCTPAWSSGCLIASCGRV